MSRPLITVLGASGFIGSRVVAELARRPVRLRTVARRPTVPAVTGRPAADVEIRTADLSRPGRVAEAVAGSDAVIHLVAHLNGAGTWRAADGDTAAERLNSGLVQELADALRPAVGADRTPAVVLFASTATATTPVGPGAGARSGSGAEAGAGAVPGARSRYEAGTVPVPGPGPRPEAGPVPVPGPGSEAGAVPGPAAAVPAPAYERHKLAAEQVLADATAAGALCGVSLRLPTVFGPAPAPAADRGVVSAMARRALDGAPITMWHDGTVRRDLLYVQDAATAFTAALDHAPALAGRHWSVGSGRGTPLGDVFRALAATVASRTGRPPVPVRQVEPPPFASAADFRDVGVDPEPFRSVTGWAPRVPLHEAVDRTVAALAGTHGKDLL
ncbi:NAD-dependent epimerase/dehydratase family protein [Streptomyces mayonensis]|uniref:NAD-dependent epimerase/dehydratase family protein n=1 Tax=Streptomyces mayonensis TaxID=2750816 RepID=UPI001C1E805C|nr:NAD-dependent epimerase/dehydratase [Streptomyces sp. A108]MBU6532318.1 NAD-dependent epimerase/dehydratase [Streptomyces sp. A108]